MPKTFSTRAALPQQRRRESLVTRRRARVAGSAPRPGRARTERSPGPEPMLTIRPRRVASPTPSERIAARATSSAATICNAVLSGAEQKRAPSASHPVEEQHEDAGRAVAEGLIGAAWSLPSPCSTAREAEAFRLELPSVRNAPMGSWGAVTSSTSGVCGSHYTPELEMKTTLHAPVFARGVEDVLHAGEVHREDLFLGEIAELRWFHALPGGEVIDDLGAGHRLPRRRVVAHVGDGLGGDAAPPSRATPAAPFRTSSASGTMSKRCMWSPRLASWGRRLWPSTPEDPGDEGFHGMRFSLQARGARRSSRSRCPGSARRCRAAPRPP